MTTVFKRAYINDNLTPSFFKTFLADVLTQMGNEIVDLGNAFYTHFDEGDNVKGVDKVFSMIERTWVAIFNDTLKKVDPKIVTIQEFSVWSDKCLEGRCDLLFEWNGLHFIVEAKSREYNINWGAVRHREEYKFFIDQARRYYEAEKKYYKKDTYLITIIFEWIRKGNLGPASDQIFEWIVKDQPENNQPTTRTDFLSLYAGTEQGLCIYGQIVDAKAPLSL